jgi:hypothetical protein
MPLSIPYSLYTHTYRFYVPVSENHVSLKSACSNNKLIALFELWEGEARCPVMQSSCHDDIFQRCACCFHQKSSLTYGLKVWILCTCRKFVKVSAFCIANLTERSLTSTTLQVGRLRVRTTHGAAHAVVYNELAHRTHFCS